MSNSFGGPRRPLCRPPQTARRPRARRLARLLAALGTALAAPPLLACSSCGCTLNADWVGQGVAAEEGLHVDLRHDAFTQDELRQGTHDVDRSALTLPNDEEIQQRTVNRNTTLTIDHGFATDWGVTVQLPYLQRTHTTIAEGDTDVSGSYSSGIGDLRVLGRYLGLSEAHDWGLQFGVKLPTGATDVDFRSGPQAGEPLDRGLQPGTGSTDLLLGVYHFGPIGSRLGYFVQGLLQLPVTSRDDFKPGAGVNLAAGLRYISDGPVTPELQLTARIERPESGAEADVPNSGATLVYASPGVTIALSPRWNLYGFVQVPLYQRVNGLQLEPRSSLSVGVNFAY
jgi:hypothetical protein